MTGWRPVALAAAVAAAGAAGTLAVGKAAGMGASDIAHLALLMLPAALVTAVAAAGARPLLRRAPLAQRFLAIALVAVAASIANLAVLAELMFVSSHDAVLMGTLLAYSVGAGAGTALVLARSASAGVDRLARTAGELAEGNLDVRAGEVGAGPELDALARALDRMASRLQSSLAHERAIEAQRRDLITAVSHDLRTPLSALRATVEAIEDGIVDDPDTLRRYVREMRRSVDSLVALIDDLFELVQLDAGALEAESRRVRLAEAVRAAVAACRAEAERKGLVVEERLNGAGSALCSPRLVRVLQNLLQNAIRHTPSEGTVRIEADQDPDALTLAVEDTGDGIGAEVADRVFEPFWRGDAARSTDGSGLGLALAKRIVEALGGTIRLTSKAERGARFEVVLPHHG
ncbi:MAG TPA: HAMP domain-containing sensor histidine kinase [Actinomycetota bacterium]|nr:HAMP domain-containing sensor histidine kinase [Actinomycetota bacterium]